MADRERWRKVPGWPGYKISSHGRARSVPRVLADGRWHGGSLLQPAPDGDGYLQVTLSDGPRTRRAGVHTLVLEAFTGPRPDGMEGCHGNGDHQDNWLSNLRWDTHLENERDKKKTESWTGTGVAEPPLRIVTPVTSELA